MTKFKVDVDKDIYNQSFWKLLKPEVKARAIKVWENYDEKKADEFIDIDEEGTNPTIHKGEMYVTIPDDQLTKKRQ